MGKKKQVDRHIPSTADLWDNSFSFIPSWRRDDVMISYATEQAGIGAHIDDYDVFLIQSRGSREWAIENKFVTPEKENARLVLDTHINILT